MNSNKNVVIKYIIKSKKIKGTKQNNSGKSRRFKDILEGNCIFPFIYKGKVFNECIPDKKGGKFNGSRCATQVDDVRNLENGVTV